MVSSWFSWVLGIYAINFDTSVAVIYDGGNSLGLPERVNNLGLMQQKQTYLIISGILVVAGIILIVFAKPSNRNPHLLKNYKDQIELGKRAEFKNNMTEAIDKYMDALYELENKYFPYNDRDIKEKEQTITWLKEKIVELKGNLT